MTHRDDSGNVQVDFVWGNLPMQPNDDRTDNGYSFGGGEGDHGWYSTYQYTSDTLRISDYYNNDSVQNLFDIRPLIGTDHIRADIGYSNFPGYIPNYEGDEDSGLEAVVPNVVRMMKNIGRNKLEAANLDYSNNYVNPQVQGVVSTGTTIRFYVDNTYGLKAGDQVWPDNTVWDYDDQQIVTVVDAGGAWFEIKAETAPDPALDTEASGTIWPGDNLYNVITAQDIAEGTIVDEGTSVEITMFGD